MKERISWTNEYLQCVRDGTIKLMNDDIKQILLNQTILEDMLKSLGRHESDLLNE